MNAIEFLPRYFFWHYTRAFKEIWGIWMNYLWFFNHFFSIPLLFRTLFSPWQRITEEYKKGLDIEDWAESFIVNVLMRIVGAVMRLVVICVGVLFLLITFIIGVLIFVVWPLFPLVVIFLIARGLLFFF